MIFVTERLIGCCYREAGWLLLQRGRLVVVTERLIGCCYRETDWLLLQRDWLVVVTERLAEIKEDEEKQRLEDMSEDEYDAMTEEEKARVDRRRLASKKERLRKYGLSDIIVCVQAHLCAS